MIYMKLLRDPNQRAKMIVDATTGQIPVPPPDPQAQPMEQRGRKSRAKFLTSEQRSEIARNAAAARWRKRA